MPHACFSLGANLFQYHSGSNSWCCMRHAFSLPRLVCSIVNVLDTCLEMKCVIYTPTLGFNSWHQRLQRSRHRRTYPNSMSVLFTGTSNCVSNSRSLASGAQQNVVLASRVELSSKRSFFEQSNATSFSATPQNIYFSINI